MTEEATATWAPRTCASRRTAAAPGGLTPQATVDAMSRYATEPVAGLA
ncbi:hypothetical protein [Streptomyces sp. NPDC057253]